MSNSIISSTAKIGKNVKIGPFTIIEDNVQIGDNCEIFSHVVIGKNTIIGNNNRIFQFSSIGVEPIDRTFHNEFSQLLIGDNNIIREFTTIHSGTAKDKGVTVIGSNNLIMNYVHIGHDCRIGNNVNLVNNCNLAGHVKVYDFATIGVGSAVHQFCKIGSYAFVSHSAIISQDVLPYVMIAGNPISPYGINVEGLKRAGFSTKDIQDLRKCYRIIYRRGLSMIEALAKLKEQLAENDKIKLFIHALENSKRGIIR